MAKKIVSILLSLFLFNLVSCQGYRYGPPRTVASGEGFFFPGNRADSKEFETSGETESDPTGGKWLIIGLAGAIVVGTAIFVPLVVKDKL